MPLILAEASWVADAWSQLRSAADGGAWTPVALGALGAVTGLVFWLLGSNLVRPLVSMITVGAAAFVGYALFPRLGLAETPQWLGAVGGAIAGLIVKGLVFRVTTAGLLAAMLALATSAGLAVSQRVDFSDSPVRMILTAERDHDESSPSRSGRGDGGERSDRGDRVGVSAEDRAGERDLWRRTGEVIGRAGHATAGALDGWRTWWAGLPAGDQSAMLLAAVASAALGLALGVLAPTFAAAIATAGLGSAGWMWAGVWLAFALEAPRRHDLPQHAGTWYSLWCAATIIGAVMQLCWTKRKRPRRPRAEAKQATPAAPAT